MPRSKQAASKSPRAARQQASQGIKTILSQREHLMADIESLRKQDTNSRFLDNARQLLTRWWAAATWSAREDLLKTAAWLVHLERRGELDLQRPVVGRTEMVGGHHDRPLRSAARSGAGAGDRTASAGRR
jgi:hypothetical protein